MGDIPQALEMKLQQECLWLDPDDLTNVIYLYADKIMYVGIVSKVVRILEEEGYTVELKFEELSKKYQNWKLNATPRPHQIPLIQEGLTHRFGFLQASPGAGKTLVACAIVAELGLPAILVTQAGEPFRQAVESFHKFTNIVPGQIGLGKLQDGEDDVYVITIQTFNNLKEDSKFHNIIKHAEVVIIDEAHHAVSDSYLNLYNTLVNVKALICLTATPWRDDDRHDLLEGLIGPVLYEVGYGDLIDNASLVPITIYTAKVPRKDYGYAGKNMFVATEFQRRKQFKKVYDDYIVNNIDRHNIIAEFVEEMQSNKLTTAVICKLISHAEALHDMIPNSVILTGKTNKEVRQKIIAKLQRHEITCVITTVFDEAVDVPSLGGVVFAAGGKSTVKAIQRLRSTRSFSGEVIWGHYHKKRGYALFLLDDADFLRSHSSTTLRVLKNEIAKHPDNELITT